MRTSIYLPDALAAEVKEHDISISAVAQTALRAAISEASGTEAARKVRARRRVLKASANANA